jgi:S-disulfanyl-L-cysteine oxidoreductase SoxD
MCKLPSPGASRRPRIGVRGRPLPRAGEVKKALLPIALVFLGSPAFAAVPSSVAPPPSAVPRVDFGLGRPATEADISAWNIDVEPDGKNLPAGNGTSAEGAKVYASACASCHGDHGQGGLAPRLVGGMDTLGTAHPVKTVGSYWPYATTVFDYIRRAMPFTSPESLTSDEVYAVVAYLLNQNGIIPANAAMDSTTLPKVKMPNRGGFVWEDPRPDVHASACMTGCR